MKNITSDRLCMLALLVIIVICVVQIYQLYNRSSMKEHMNPALLTHQIEDLTSKPGDPVSINYYVKEDRYSKDLKLSPTLIDPLSMNSSLKCGPQMNWDTLSMPGANNVYGDMIWHKTSPRMVFERNDFSCGNVDYNSPVGTHDIEPSCGSGYDLAQSLSNFGTVGALSDQHLMSTPENLEKFINM
ncbi:hypothetical protein Indivirus_1_151 [Indivirus ILV1]|uniref:Uncharacterized protein n=1 Tax=Indivirus ILV1 TaxID=1977633 RepID=A0A1V0SCZ2_9VIRU|nr:hypothetical protein Indivirus_1_151 [Indivirus ILV1]